MLGEGDEGAVGAEDSGLFAGDFGDGVAEVVLVVERDVGDDGEEGLDDVGGVEAAAHADFEDGDVDFALGKVEEGERGEGLEEAGMVRELAFGDEALGGFVDLEVEAGEGFFWDFVERGCWMGWSLERRGAPGKMRGFFPFAMLRVRMTRGEVGFGGADALGYAGRSEERRVGEEGRFRGAADPLTTKN